MPLRMTYENRMKMNARLRNQTRRLSKRIFRSKPIQVSTNQEKNSCNAKKQKKDITVCQSKTTHSMRRSKSTFFIPLKRDRENKASSLSKTSEDSCCSKSASKLLYSPPGISSSSPCLLKANFDYPLIQEHFDPVEKMKNIFLTPVRKATLRTKVRTHSMADLNKISVIKSSRINSSMNDILQFNSTPTKLSKKDDKRRWWRNMSFRVQKRRHRKSLIDEEIKNLQLKQINSSILRTTNYELGDSSFRNSLQDLLKNKVLTQRFRQFLQKEFSEENLDFWFEVEKYKNVKDQNRRKSAEQIYSTFLAEDSPKEINVNADVRKTTKESMMEPNKATFDSAQNKIYTLMEMDSYRRFIAKTL